MLYLYFYRLTGGTPYAYYSPLFRATVALLLAFVIVCAFGPLTIRILKRRKIRDRSEFDHDHLNKLAGGKSDTPTMGGALIVISILLSVVLLADVSNFYVIMGLLCLLWLAVLGGVDDWLKLSDTRRSGTRAGLRSWEKLVFQIGLAVLLAGFILREGQTAVQNDFSFNVDATPSPYYNVLNIPFYKGQRIGEYYGVALAAPAFIIITLVVIVGTSNAVNLTDGMDGLASGCMVLTALAFMALAAVVGSEELSKRLLLYHIRGSAELSVICGATAGACLGFLWYNCHPAQIFMGDTGSLPLGGLMGYVAIVTRLELMLLIVGGIFVIEALSVILQVGYFKCTGGKRLFRVAPIHHHFHLGGLSETQVVMRFWLVAALFAVFALATLKLR